VNDADSSVLANTGNGISDVVMAPPAIAGPGGGSGVADTLGAGVGDEECTDGDAAAVPPKLGA
jgi:hypothetical protein